MFKTIFKLRNPISVNSILKPFKMAYNALKQLIKSAEIYLVIMIDSMIYKKYKWAKNMQLLIFFVI